MPSKLTPERRARLPGSFRRAAKRRLTADHRLADPIVCRLFADLQAARDVEQNVPSKAARARLLERLAWGHLMQYLMTLEVDDEEV